MALAAYYNQEQIDALISNLQNKIDILEQSLFDCGCIFEPFIQNFSTGIGDVSESGTWDVSWDQQAEQLVFACTSNCVDQNVWLYVNAQILLVPGLVVEYKFIEQENISSTDVLIGYTTESGTTNKDIDAHIQAEGSVGLDPLGLPEGQSITGIEFKIWSVDEPISSAEFRLDYVRIVKPEFQPFDQQFLDDGGVYQLGAVSELWEIDVSAQDRIRVKRVNGVTSRVILVSVPVRHFVSADGGVYLEFSMRNDTWISETEVRVKVAGVSSYTVVYTGVGDETDFIESIQLPATMNGAVIYSVDFQITATDESTTFARWTLDYLRLVKP